MGVAARVKGGAETTDELGGSDDESGDDNNIRNEKNEAMDAEDDEDDEPSKENGVTSDKEDDEEDESSEDEVMVGIDANKPPRMPSGLQLPRWRSRTAVTY